MRNKNKIKLFAMMVALALLLAALPLATALAEDPTPASPEPAGDGHIFLLQDVSDEEKGFLQIQSAYIGEDIDFYVPILNKNLESATDLTCSLPVPDPANADAYPFSAAPQINPEKTWDSINSQVVGWDGKVLAIGDRAYFRVKGTILATATPGMKTLSFVITYNGTMTDTVKVNIEVREKSDGGGSSSGGSSYKSKPKVILESYSFSEDTIYAGDTVTLRLVVANTSKREAITNLQLDFSNEAGAILPAPGGSSSVFIGTIDKDDAYVLSVKLQVTPDADAKSQLLAIKLSYEGTKNRSDFEETASVSVPVQQKARVRINDPIVYDDPWVGTNVAVGVTLYNLGKSSLYNCMVDVVGDGLTLEESYFGGNVAAGGTMRADLNVTPTIAGQLDAKVRVTYEDVNGNPTETLLPLNMVVNEEPAGGAVSPGNGATEIPGDAPANANIGWVFWALGGVAVVTGLVVVGVKMKKKRERALEEE
ncbi:MAG: hypothetical protein VB061_14025 [Christensenella sp.]|nr:hypothetical protein [Christensenella sp.]